METGSRSQSGYESTEVLSADSSRCCRFHPRKFPLNRAVLVLLVVSTLERYAFFNITPSAFRIAESYSQLNVTKNTVHSKILAETVLDSVPFLLYPFAGYLADVRFGRLNVITSGLLICATCYGLLAFMFSLGFAAVWQGPSMAAFFAILFVVLCAGSAAVQVNMVPFLADQVRGAWGEELSSLFHWYYWTRNIITVAAVSQLLVDCSQHQSDSADEIVVYTTFTLSAVALALALCVLFCCKQWLHHQKEIKNPLTLVVNVIKFACKAKYDPHQSAFTINKDPPPRLDLAKIRYGGPFTSTQVEDVKTFYRLLSILFSMMGTLMLITAVITVLQLFSDVLIKSTKCYFDGGILLTVAENLTILIIIPVFDKLVYPLLGGYTPNMLNRVGIGSVLCLISASIISAVFYSFDLARKFPVTKIQNHKPNIWYIPVGFSMCSAALLGLSEVLIEVGALEFAYAQSPREMKGFMVGMFYFVWGLGSLVAEVILLLLTNLPIVMILSFFALLLYLWLSYHYKRPDRDDDEERDLDNLTYESALDVLRSQMRSPR